MEQPETEKRDPGKRFPTLGWLAIVAVLVIAGFALMAYQLALYLIN